LGLVDELIEQGRLPQNCSPNGEVIKYRKALEDLVDGCVDWGAGMQGIHCFEEARKLLEDGVKE
jgi:hypothetical protein